MSNSGSQEKIGRTSKPRPWDPSGGDAASFGTWLRRQREVREITLREIADTTKIGLRYLEAMERDEFDALPAPVFAKGFLRQYARYVGLDPDEAVNNYLEAQQARDGGDPAADEEEPEETPDDRRPWLLALLALALVLLLVAAGWLVVAWWTGGEPGVGVEPGPAGTRAAERRVTGTADGTGGAPAGGPGAAPGVTGPETSEPRTVPASPAGTTVADPGDGEPAPLVVIVEFSQDCWIEAEVDGERYISELHVQGESLRIEARERVVFETIGNADGVRVEVNGEPWPLPRSPGQSVVRGLEIALPPDAAAAAPEAAE